jgi:hypothetical protein
MRRRHFGLSATANGAAQLPGLEAAGKGNKYGAKITVGIDPCGGTRRYASKREALRAAELFRLKQAGTIADFFPQCSLAFGVGAEGQPERYVSDFLVVEAYHPDGTFTGWFEDPKGADTERSRAKRSALRARGLQVRVL